MGFCPHLNLFIRRMIPMNIEELRTSLLNTNKNGYTRITAEQ